MSSFQELKQTIEKYLSSFASHILFIKMLSYSIIPILIQFGKIHINNARDFLSTLSNPTSSPCPYSLLFKHIIFKSSILWSINEEEKNFIAIK